MNRINRDDVINKKNRIKELREAQELTQEQFGKIINVGKSTVSKYEQGSLEISNNKLNTICDYFNVSSDYVLGFEEKSKDQPESILDKFGVYAQDVEEIVEIMHKNPQIKLLFSAGKNLSKGELEKILKIIEVMQSEEDETQSEN